MGKTTFRLLFYIRKTRLNKNGEAPILFRLTTNGVRADAHTYRFINPKLWNTAKGKALESGKGCKKLNYYFDAIQARILRTRLDMELEGATVTAQSVLNRYLGKDTPERHTLIELFCDHNKKCRALSGIDFAPGTVERYEVCLRHTQEFMHAVYHKNDIYLDELSRQFIEDYEFYLKTVRKCCHNTTTKYIKNFKKIVLTALKKEWLKKGPFAEIKFHREEVERDFLESHEIKKMIDKQIDIPRMVQMCNVYIFCCYTGLAFTDVEQWPSHRPRHQRRAVDSQTAAKDQKYV